MLAPSSRVPAPFEGTALGLTAGVRAAPVDESLSPAEALLVEFLGQHSLDDLEAFERYCAPLGEHVEKLRELREHWARIDSVLGARLPADATPTGAGTSALALAFAQAASAAPREVRPVEPLTTGFEALHDRLSARAAHSARYTLQRELGRGGMGVVYAAWDGDLRRTVAMKVLRDEGLGLGAVAHFARARRLARFLAEAQITGQLDHPGIVPVYDVGLDGQGRVFFTMPLVLGRELREVLQLAVKGSEGWSRERALGVFVKVCEALAFAHAKGVVHRDLKPSNVMVGAFGEAYVMDWGLARLSAAPEPEERGPSELVRTDLDVGSANELATRDGAVLGTPAYMAPEQARGRTSAVGPHSDIYSLGAMLYHLLSGSMPYVDSTERLSAHALIAARLAGPPTPLERLAAKTPPELIAICAKAMADEPTQRYATALELAADLEAYLGRRPVRAFDATPAYLVGLAIRRNRAVALALAAGALVAVGLGVRDVVRSRAAAHEQLAIARDLAVANQRLQREADVLLARTLCERERSLRMSSEEELERTHVWRREAQALLARDSADSPAERELHAALGFAFDRVSERVSRFEAQSAEDEAAWRRACASIAASPLYRGLQLERQWGLAPLQLNPQSGLWEFWVVESGAQPQVADAATGRLAPDPASAIVLVLVPGGVARLGSARNDLGRNLLFPPPRGCGRVENEDERRLQLEPFFLGKCEVTQAVWQRVNGANPAQFSDAEVCKYEPWTALLPVESVSWRDAHEFANKLGLALPSEAQWEYAARCGDPRPLAFGSSDDLAALAGKENLNDRLGCESNPAPAALLSSPWCDGYWSVAPVMSFAPNAWGLHDLLGNVSEACSDVYVEAPLGGVVLGLDGRAPLEEGRFRSFRGASYATARAEAVRVAFRQWDRPQGTNHIRGVRVARPVR
jgi:formylglycine-generating enzyme required for sulfatase activity